jgi:NAD(P)-dependent dehydrogenase (short-subunit alcohol dehydrogenase family)
MTSHMKDHFDLSGRKALITGASRGIGLAIARGFAQRRATVVITGRKAEPLQAAADDLRREGMNATPIVCHQGDSAAIQSLFDEIDRSGQFADIVVINAATNPIYAPLLATDVAAWQKTLEVNLTGALLTAQHAARRMLVSKSGSLILMASLSGIDPFVGLGAYSVSKAGLLALMRTLAKELGPNGIRVNAIAPGLVETRFSAALFQNTEAYQQLINQVPLRRHGQPEDIVGAAVFLASDASAYVTGQVLVVDGGARM